MIYIYNFSGRTEFQAAVTASLNRDRSISFERRPSQRYPRRGKIQSSQVSSSTLNIDSNPHQQIVVHNQALPDHPEESLLENISIPNTHRKSNLSINQRDEPVILPNPNHHIFNDQTVQEQSQIHLSNTKKDIKQPEKAYKVEVHRNIEKEDVKKENVDNGCMNINNDTHANTNLRFDLTVNDVSNRHFTGFPHSVASKRISSSSSGGYSATDEVDYLKWVSETKGQLRHTSNKKIAFATDTKEKHERAGNKSLNSSSSGVSSVESCPVDNDELKLQMEQTDKNYCSSMSSRQQSSSPNSSSSGHGSPESSTMAQNDISCDARASENDNEVKISDGRIEDSKEGSPLSSISRVNSSSPDSGYEHLSSTGKYNTFVF